MALAASKLEVAKAKRLWEANQLTIDEICRLTDRSPPWLYHHMRKGKWIGREMRCAAKKGTPANKAPLKAFAKVHRAGIYRGSAHWAAMQRIELAHAESLRYGPLLADVRFLQGRDYVVLIEGERFRLGNRLVDSGTLQETAARERRLMGGNETHDSG